MNVSDRGSEEVPLAQSDWICLKVTWVTPSLGLTLGENRSLPTAPKKQRQFRYEIRCQMLLQQAIN